MFHFRFKFKKCFTAIALIATVFMITIIFLPYLGEDALMSYWSLASFLFYRWHNPGESGIHSVAVCSELHPARRLCHRGSRDTQCFWTGTLWGHLWPLLQPLPSPYGCKLDFEGMILIPKYASNFTFRLQKLAIMCFVWLVPLLSLDLLWSSFKREVCLLMKLRSQRTNLQKLKFENLNQQSQFNVKKLMPWNQMSILKISIHNMYTTNTACMMYVTGFLFFRWIFLF